MSEYQLPENFKPISLQDIFNAAWQAFIVENRPPATEVVAGRTSCRYLTEEGRKCAVGLCIPDGHEAQGVEAEFSRVVREYPELWDTALLDMPHSQLDRFQRWLHDDYTEPHVEGWSMSLDERREAYRYVASMYDLTIPGESDVQG